MKQFLSLALIVAVFISSSSFRVKDDHKIVEAPNNKVEVVFNRQLDFGDIVKIKLDMAQKGIILDYKKLQFDENGKLKAIDFSVDLKDGFSGSASNDELTNQSHFGFYRDYKEKVSSPFGVGNF
ncbi:MAG: hypothetical protein WKG06_23660 [Segetibacter sp.]